MVSNNVELCRICLGELDVSIRTLSCGHEYHDSCVEEWIKIHPSCPYCRKRVKRVDVEQFISEHHSLIPIFEDLDQFRYEIDDFIRLIEVGYMRYYHIRTALNYGVISGDDYRLLIQVFHDSAPSALEVLKSDNPDRLGATLYFLHEILAGFVPIKDIVTLIREKIFVPSDLKHIGFNFDRTNPNSELHCQLKRILSIDYLRKKWKREEPGVNPEEFPEYYEFLEGSDIPEDSRLRPFRDFVFDFIITNNPNRKKEQEGNTGTLLQRAMQLVGSSVKWLFQK